MKEANTAMSVRLNPRTEALAIWLSAEFLTCGLAGERRCAEKARATVEETTPLCVLKQLCARALPKVPEREIERRRTSEGCRKASRSAVYRPLPSVMSAKDDLGIQGGGKHGFLLAI